MTGNGYSVRCAAGPLQRGKMVGQRKEIRDAVFVQDALRQDDVRAEEDVTGKVAELSRRVAEEWDGLEANPGDLVGAGCDDRIDRARISKQKIPSQRIKRIGASEKRCWLQQGVAEERLVEPWSMNDRAGPLHDRRVTAEMIGVGVRGKHCHDVAAELLAHNFDRLLGTRLVEPSVHEHDLPVVIS